MSAKYPDLAIRYECRGHSQKISKEVTTSTDNIPTQSPQTLCSVSKNAFSTPYTIIGLQGKYGPRGYYLSVIDSIKYCRKGQLDGIHAEATKAIKPIVPICQASITVIQLVKQITTPLNIIKQTTNTT